MNITRGRKDMKYLKTIIGFLFGIIFGIVCIPFILAHDCYVEEEWPWQVLS